MFCLNCMTFYKTFKKSDKRLKILFYKKNEKIHDPVSN